MALEIRENADGRGVGCDQQVERIAQACEELQQAGGFAPIE